MKQMILLEKSDLDAIRIGGTLTINAGSETVTIGYSGKTYKKRGPVLNGHAPRKKTPCKFCGKRLNAQVMAPHVAMHERNRDKVRPQ